MNNLIVWQEIFVLVKKEFFIIIQWLKAIKEMGKFKFYQLGCHSLKMTEIFASLLLNIQCYYVSILELKSSMLTRVLTRKQLELIYYHRDKLG
jgi:hypothetical protein